MSTEMPGSDVRILTAFSVNIHKRKKGILPVECMGLAQEKGAPVLPGAPPIGNVYSNLRNQIHLPPQNVSSCRKRIKKFRTAFCVIFGVCYQNSISRRYLCSASCQVGSFSNPFSVSFSLLMRLLDGRFAFAGYWSELTGDTLTFP